MTSLSSTRRCAAFLSVVAVTLAVSCAVPAAAIGSITYYTVDQQKHTRLFLQSFIEAMPGLASIWTSDNFCQWTGILCLKAGVGIAGTRAMLVSVAGTLPELPDTVDVSQVVVTGISFNTNYGQLTGTLPSSWSALTSLTSLSFAQNSLSGTLPASWSAMSGLLSVNLFSNVLSGTLPASWGTFTKCMTVSLYNNSFSGTLPAEWSALTQLRSLLLRSNTLSGTLPTSWQSFTGLVTLYLNDNDLSGSIPPSWASMSSLAAVSLTSNNFCGCLPSAWVGSGSVSVYADAGITSSTCAKTNACVATTTTEAPTTTTEAPTGSPACNVPHCQFCSVISPSYCRQCGPGYDLTADFLCRKQSSDVAAAHAVCGWAAVTAVAMAAVLVA